MSKSMCGVIFCLFWPPSSVSFYLKTHIVAGGYAKFFPEYSQNRPYLPEGWCICLHMTGVCPRVCSYILVFWHSHGVPRHRLEIHFLGEKNHQDAASVVELAEITCQKWSIRGETGHKSLYLPSRIAHQLVEVNWSTQKVEKWPYFCVLWT